MSARGHALLQLFLPVDDNCNRGRCRLRQSRDEEPLTVACGGVRKSVARNRLKIEQALWNTGFEPGPTRYWGTHQRAGGVYEEELVSVAAPSRRRATTR